MMKKFVIFLILAIVGFVTFFVYVLMPTPNFLRNNSIEGIRINVKVSDDDRLPIIRTYKASEYNNFSDDKLNNIKDKISGKIEGDIPAVHLLTNDLLTINFYKNDVLVNPDEIPNIKIYAHASHYEDKNKISIIEDTLQNSNNYNYLYKIKRYKTQFEKYFLEYLRVEISYSIDGEKYISTFGIFSDNANDGVNFFENEKLQEPILVK